MTTFLQFASNNPYLTFFVIVIVLMTIVKIVQWIAYAIRGGKPPKHDFF
jgi:hypothetical protein